MSKSTRTLALLTRTVLRAHPLTRARHGLLRQSGPIDVRPVRFQSPPLGYSRILRITAQFALTGYLFYLVNEYFWGYEEEEDRPGAETAAPSIAVASKSLPQGVEATKAPEAEQVEELLAQLPDKMPEDAIFIPLWWGKRRPETFYTESDPEWRDLVKFAHDEKRVESMKDTLVRRSWDSIKSPELIKFLGTPVKFDRRSLEIDYPPGPPPEYDRPGIEIANDYVALTSRPQSEQHYARVKSALWPEAITRSFYNSLCLYCSLQYLKIKGFLNVNTETENPKYLMFPHLFNLLKVTKSPEKQGPPMGSKLDKLSDPKSADTKITGTTTTTTTGTGAAKPFTTGVSPDSAKILSYLPDLKKSEGDLGAAIGIFKRTLVKTYRAPGTIERGAFYVSGLVDVIGSKGKIVLDVRATFHPETNHYNILEIVCRKRVRRVSKG